MKKFLLLIFIIILVTKDIFGSTINPRQNSQKFESSTKPSNQPNNNDITENSYATDKETTIDSKSPDFGSELERLKDLMVDYIKAKGKIPMTHEFNKNSRKIIDYLNSLLAKIRPEVMRDLIEDILEKMNAMLEMDHENFPNEGQSDEFSESDEDDDEQYGKFDSLLKSEIESLMNPKIIEENLRIFEKEFFENFEEDLEPKLMHFESKLLEKMFPKLYNVENNLNPIQIKANMLQKKENIDSQTEPFVSIKEIFQNLILQKLRNFIQGSQGMNTEIFNHVIKQNFVAESLQNFMDKISRNFKINPTLRPPSLQEIITKLTFAVSQFLFPKSNDPNQRSLMPQILRNLQMIPTSNFEKIFQFLKSLESQNLNNAKYGEINPQTLMQQLTFGIKQIIAEYLKAINLIIEDRLLKSREAVPQEATYKPLKIEDANEETKKNASHSVQQQRGDFQTKEMKSTEEDSTESSNRTYETKITRKFHLNQTCTDCGGNNIDSNAKTNQSNISSETTESNNKEEIKISEEKIKNSQEASNCTDCGHYENSTIHSQEISTEDKINCTDCGNNGESANYSQQVAKSEAEEEEKIKNQEVEEENLNSEKTMPGSTTEHDDDSESSSEKTLENFTEHQQISTENPDEQAVTQQNFPENSQNSLQSSTDDQPTTIVDGISEKNEETVTEINQITAATEDLSRNVNIEAEISTDKTKQNSTEFLNANEDLQSSIDVSTSTQSSLDTEESIETENPTESNFNGEDEALERLRRLEEISRNLREGNFTENDMIKVDNYKTEIIELINYFRDTKYYEYAQEVNNDLLSLTKTLEIFKIAASIVNSNDTSVGLQDIETLMIKLDIIKNFYTNRNDFIVVRAKELKEQLRDISDQIRSQNPEIPQELLTINQTYSNPENYNLKFLNEAKHNLTTISLALKSINSSRLADDLLHKVQNLINNITGTQQELKSMEIQIKVPSNATELAKLNEYKQKLLELRIQPEPSIYKKAIELDESIKKVIKEYQIKTEINEVNLALNRMNVSLETAQSGNEINSNMMELKNLEMKIESLDGNEEDIEKVKQSIKQIQMEIVRVAVRNDARVLYTIVNQFINIMKGTQSDIDSMNNQFLKLEQLNSSRFDLNSLNVRKNLIINDYNRIYRDLSDIRLRLEHLGFASANNQTLNQIKDLNDISEVLEYLSGLDHILKDSQTSELYMKTFKNLQDVEQLRDGIKNVFKFMSMLEYFEKKKNLSESRENNGNLGTTGSYTEYSDQNDNNTESSTQELDSGHDEQLSNTENVKKSEDNQEDGHDPTNMSSNLSDSSKIDDNEGETTDQNESSNSEGQSEDSETQPKPKDPNEI